MRCFRHTKCQERRHACAYIHMGDQIGGQEAGSGKGIKDDKKHSHPFYFFRVRAECGFSPNKQALVMRILVFHVINVDRPLDTKIITYLIV